MRENRAKRETGKPNPRNIALSALMDILEEDEYCDKALHKWLDKYPELERRDRAFITRLTQGTIERLLELDYLIDHLAKMPVRDMKPVIRELLRMSVYQIVYMDQVPDRAACDEAVKLTHIRRVVPLSGFVNGVLRNIARYYDTIPYPERSTDLIHHLSVWCSMPEWIVKRFASQYGEKQAEEILQSFLDEKDGLCVRCNLAQASREEIIGLLREQGISYTQGKFFPEALYLRDYGRIDEVLAFQKGWITVQDEGSMVVGAVAKVDESSTVIDVCAAPGAKSLHLADKMKGQGLIRACDITEQKVSLIRENLKRIGIHNVKLKRQDAGKLREEWMGTADLVIADLPCSGLGVIGNKPDIKYKIKPKDISSLVRKQQQILRNVVNYIKEDGYLFYSTCTMTREENEEQAAWIAKNLPLEPISIEQSLPKGLQGLTGEQGMIQILPTMTGGDGFFLAAFRKRRGAADD